ncbi:MAG: T9SS type A sorting domain-containing protein [Ignavibacteria bacterium]|nr:T9SS type A sorting domain-containing protein [Ignavibacteria bacterium]
MKKVFLFCTLVLTAVVFGQQASTFYPASAGYKWYFKNVPLDSLNNPVPSKTTYEVDSAAGTKVYLGVTANYMLRKVGPVPGINALPYIDTSYVNFSGTDAMEYFRVPNLDTLLKVMHASGLDTVFGAFNIIATLKSFQKWYTMYKFQQTAGSQYEVFKYDTVVTRNSTNIPLRFWLKGKRLSDVSLSTELGTFTAKPFVLDFSINYLVTFPITIAIPFVTLPDTIYMAPGLWRVRSVMPTTVFDLSFLSMGQYTIPGYQADVLQKLPNSVQEHKNTGTAASYKLDQNYPNPFNPVTTINFSIPQEGKVEVTVYNAIGQKVACLLNATRSAGSYSLVWNAASMTSGVYYCKLTCNGAVEVKKMALLK